MLVKEKQLPRYKCNKEVWALKIWRVHHHGAQGGATLYMDDGFNPVIVSEDWVDKRNPHAGGYYVVYEDGYSSFSPAEPFESGYTLID